MSDLNQKSEPLQVQKKEQVKEQKIQQNRPEKEQQNKERNPEKQQAKKPEEIQKEMELHQKHLNMIRQQVEAESPLIGQLFPLAILMDQFVDNQGFYIKIQSLMSIYDQYRKTRRDGSCFYRALNFCIFQKIVCKGNNNLKEHMVKKIKDSKDHLLKANFQGIVFQDLQQIFLQKLGSKLPKNLQELLKMFRDPEDSNYLVMLLRFITSGEIRNNAILYETFMYDQMPADMFCQIEVEPIDKEADQIQIMALLNYLEVGIKIVYLDGTKNKEPYKVILPESFKENQVVGELLYRPGHYDILYK